MAMRSKSLLLAGAAVVATSACTPVDSGFGEAARYDMMAQTENPDPVYPEGSLEPGYHGEKAQKAAERYRKGTTKPVERQTTSNAGPGN
jgi:hypothetical protein